MYLDYIVVASCALLALGIRQRYRKAYLLPPGPPATLLGNVHHIPRTEPWIAFRRFAEQYGPMVCLWMFNHKTIILGDFKTANALLIQRSAIYSSRPTLWMSGHLAGRDAGVFLAKTTGPRFRIFRTLLHKTLNPRALESYKALQMSECQTLLKCLKETPDKFISHLRRNAVAVIMSVAYGYQVDDEDDKFVGLLEESFRLTGSLNVPGKFWIEFMPFLRYIPEWMPGAGFKKLARTAGEELLRIDNVPFDWAKSQIESGSYNESFVSDHLHAEQFASSEDERQDILRWCAVSLYVGGGDTTVSVLTTFFLLMALHPEIQQRAREEIDRVLGHNTATHEDRSSLPYVNAMIKEITRWGPVAPLAIPHEVIQDDDYDGYFIPKGTRIIPNVYAMTRDESVYPNPNVFDPTRFLGTNRQMDPNDFVFGFGRRICPGIHLAESSLFLNITNILANFTISKKVGENGQVVEPQIQWTTGITAHLKPFPCQITPRSVR